MLNWAVRLVNLLLGVSGRIEGDIYKMDEKNLPPKGIGYDEAKELLVGRMRLKGFSDRDTTKYTFQFLKNLPKRGIYDPHQVSKKVDDFSNFYFVEGGNPEKYDFLVPTIGEKEYMPQNSKVMDPISFLGEGIYNHILKELGEKCKLTLENIVDTPVTRKLFLDTPLYEKVENVRFISENYHPLDQRVIYEVTGLKEDGTVGSIKWTEENSQRILLILNDYYSDGKRKKNFHKISPITMRIYGYFHRHPLFREDFEKALKGRFNQ